MEEQQAHRILILDLNPKTHWARALESMLGRDPLFSAFHAVNYRVVDKEENWRAAVLDQIQESSLVFISFGEAQRAQAGQALESLQLNSRVAVILVPDASSDHITELLNRGALDFLSLPLNASAVLARINRALLTHPTEHSALSRLKERLGICDFIGQSDLFMAELRRLPKIARSEMSVLITGQSGTGKELYARALHQLSPRAAGPFVPVNCGMLEGELVESSLFGHAAGAFTSARETLGLVPSAADGTLFLDEVDSLPEKTQVKFLRLLQEREYRRLGSHKDLRVNIRVVAATNCAPRQALDSGRLRHDFYYRLNGMPVRLPSLSERKGDILLLATHFLKAQSLLLSQVFAGFSPRACCKLLDHNWPGNIRELQNVVKRAAVMAERTWIEASDIELDFHDQPDTCRSFEECKRRASDQFEKEYLKDILAAAGGNISAAARLAGKERRTFWGLLRKHKLN